MRRTASSLLAMSLWLSGSRVSVPPWLIDEAHLMAQARDVGAPTAEVLGLKQLDYRGELLPFSVQQLLPGRSLEELIGEPPAPDLERLVMDAGELLARVHSVVPDGERGIRHELRLPEECVVAKVARIVGEGLGPVAAEVVKRGADFLRQEATTRPAPPFSLAQGDFLPKNLLIHGGTVVGVIDCEFAGPASPALTSPDGRCRRRPLARPLGPGAPRVRAGR